MITLIFATNNSNKVQEVQSIVGAAFHVLSLKEAGIDIDIPEPFNTLEENAWTKANTIYILTQKNCFSEDTGLEVDALNGAPGVKSARYASDINDPAANIKKLLANMSGITARTARFRTVLAMILNGKRHSFEGICRGTIVLNLKGNNGFGYDPIFVPEGASKTFAEMTITEKNQYSHRQKAMTGLINFLSKSWK
jgi:XTP/dITP diphosphohydrolase